MASKSQMAVAAAGMVLGLGYGWASMPAVNPAVQASSSLAALEQVMAQSQRDEGGARPGASCAPADEP